MKNSFEVEKNIDSQKYKFMLDADHREIDNPNRRHFSRLYYIDRIFTVVDLIKKKFPNTNDIKVAEFGCAQANMSLLLAEAGFHSIAVDIDPAFLEYAKAKYERGTIELVQSEALKLDWPENSIDVAILGEIVEHCAYPEDLVKQVMKWIKPGGMIVITTPNGSRIKSGLPTFSSLQNREARKIFEEKQFGPDGKDHLFLFTLDELKMLVPVNGKIIDQGYLGGTILVNKLDQWALKILPVKFGEKSIRAFSKIPVINKKTYNNIYGLIEKVA